MQWSTYLSSRDDRRHVGVLVGHELFGRQQPGTLTDLIGSGVDLQSAADEARRTPFEVLEWTDASVCAPVPRPPSIRDFMAFEEHVLTSSKALNHSMDPDWYEIPVFYFSNPAAVLGPYDDVPVAPGSHQFDYELEVAAVVGTAGSDLHPDEAERHIAGYLILCDWSARDLQGREMRQNLGPAKGKDTATSLGPVLVTPDELAPHRAGNSYALTMRASVNGVQYSEGTMSTIYWSFGQLLAYASRGTELQPGDIIGSGTVGTGCILELSRTHGSEHYPWLQPGDTVRLEVDQLGAIESHIVAGATPIPLR